MEIRLRIILRNPCAEVDRLKAKNREAYLVKRRPDQDRNTLHGFQSEPLSSYHQTSIGPDGLYRFRRENSEGAGTGTARRLAKGGACQVQLNLSR